MAEYKLVMYRAANYLIEKYRQDHSTIQIFYHKKAAKIHEEKFHAEGNEQRQPSLKLLVIY